MSRKGRCAVAVLTLLLLPAMAMAQLDSDEPGYFPIETLGILPDESINIEINLTGAMMKLIALATHEDEPELAQMVENLDSIRVRGSDLEGVSVDDVRLRMREAAKQLEAAGWMTMVRMREEDEEIFVYVKEQGDDLVGLTVLSLESDEAMLINLVGLIDPAALGGLAQGLDLPELERAIPEEKP